MFTVGVNLLGNDTSVAILDRDGAIVAIAEEERYSRVKGGRRWAPPALVLDVLDEHGVPRHEVRRLATARIQSMHARRPPAPPSSAPAIDYWEQARSVSTDWLVEQLPSCEAVVEVRHHLCHAASAFYPSPFDAAAVVTADGVGEVETATIWRADRDSGLEQVWSAALPHSLGYAYEAVAAWVGLTGVEREGKLMGLAALGKPRLADVVRDQVVRPDPDRVFVVADELAALPPVSDLWVEHLVSVFGPRGAGGNDVRDLDADVAASIQLVLEECLEQLAATAKRLTGADRCVAAGGVFMNSVANGRLRRGGTFADLWVQPLAGDAGTSLGAALVAHGGRCPGARMRHAFLGSALGDVDVAVRRGGLVASSSDGDDGDVYERVADLLLAGKIVGWASGRSEVGPRALGHRSILADPRRPEIREKLNAHTKERERWRPFAPIVLEEDVAEMIAPPLRVPFMNMVLDARAPERMPAAVHVDGTVRLQTVAPDEPELAHLRRLLRVVRERTGAGVLLNTSLNGRGEPIARSAGDVVAVHRSCRLDAVVIDGTLYVDAVDAVDAARDASPGDSDDPPAGWHVVAPWWQPSPAMLRQACGDHGHDTGVLVAVPVWVEVAGTVLGGLLRELVPDGVDGPVVLLDESGRRRGLARSAAGGAGPAGNAIERWWRSRLAPPVGAEGVDP